MLCRYLSKIISEWLFHDVLIIVILLRRLIKSIFIKWIFTANCDFRGCAFATIYGRLESFLKYLVISMIKIIVAAIAVILDSRLTARRIKWTVWRRLDWSWWALKMSKTPVEITRIKSTDCCLTMMMTITVGWWVHEKRLKNLFGNFLATQR